MDINLAIVGSRIFEDYETLEQTVDEIRTRFNVVKIVSGGAKGADSLAEKYAKENNIETMIFYPNWAKYGKKAGFLRNETIVDNSDMILAFWDRISNGTKHTITIANAKNKRVLIKEF